MKLSFQQTLCVLLSVLLLVQTAGASLYLQSQQRDTDQKSQQIPAEQMAESHDCCDNTVKACCSCDLGCECSIAPAFLTTLVSVSGSEKLFSSLLSDHYPIYISLALEQPEHPPRR